MNTTKNTAARRQTAAEAYAAHLATIEKQIADLNKFLTKHSTEFVMQGRTNWGFNGDLGRVEELLEQAVAAVGGPMPEGY